MSLNVNKLDARYQSLRTERSGWDSAWADLAELFLPTRWRSDTDTTSHQQPVINGRLIDSTGVRAMRTLAAGLQGGMTSPVRPWFRLRLAHEPDKVENGINVWLDEVTERMRYLLHQSNFYNAIHGLYADLGAFGTGLLIEDADENGLKFHRVDCGEYVLDVNGDGFVDSFFRRMNLTSRQIIDLWGESNVPHAVVTSAKDNAASGVTRWDVIQGVFPREDLRYGDPSYRGKPYVSVYWITAGAGNSGARGHILSEGGYDMFPAFAPRWDIHFGDVYGRSPAMDVMPDARMLQAMAKTHRIMEHKIADPPLLGDASLRRYGVDRNPGGFTYGEFSITQGKPLVMPIQQPDSGAIQYSWNALQDVRKIVEEGLYVDLFRMLLDDDRNQHATATEIQAKQSEKMLLIGPVVERLQTELLSPLIKRTYQLMQEWQALPPAPEGMGYTELDVEFESVLAQAQKVTATSAIEQGVAFTVNLSGAKPEALDLLQVDETVKAYMDRIGMPQACLAEDSQVKALRQQRAQQQQMAMQQQAMAAEGQAAQDITGAAKNLGQTPVGADGSTLMDTLLGGITGAGGM